MRDATFNLSTCNISPAGFNPYTSKGWLKAFQIVVDNQSFNPRIFKDKMLSARIFQYFFLIHASARDATEKSYKIGNNFTVLFRKFVQIFDILILHISIF